MDYKPTLAIGVARGEDDWSAATLDWDTQPGFSEPLGTVTYSFVEEEQYTWDVTQHVADEVAGGDGRLSLVMLQVEVPRDQRGAPAVDDGPGAGYEVLPGS